MFHRAAAPKPIVRRVGWALALVALAAVVLSTGSQAFVSHKLVAGGNVTVPGSGTGSPYPTSLNVSGLDGVIESMTVTFFVTHPNPDDLDIMVVGPNGASVVLMSDAGGSADLSNKQVRFADGAAAVPDSSTLTGVEYKPTNYGAGDPFPAPAPGGSPETSLGAAFGGTNPNGTWKLFVVDDSAGSAGNVNSWRVTITTRVTVQGPGFTIPSAGKASNYPSLISIGTLRGKISRVEVRLLGISHNNPDDLDVLLLGPSGDRIRLMSDAGGAENLTNVNLRFADAAASELPNGDQITAGTYKPTNYGLGDDNFPSPAPGTPYGSTLSVFNGDRAEGNWRLFVNDDESPTGGSIANWSLTIVTVNNPPSIASIPNQVVDTGKTLNVNLTGTDAEGDPLTWSLDMPSFASLTSTTGTSTTLHLAPLAGDAGTYNNVRVLISDGEFSTSRAFNITVNDRSPPTTTATLTPPSNAAGWNGGSVDVGLSAVDLDSTLQSITYTAAGAQSLPLTTVNASSAALPTITAEGITVIQFHATDTAGNVEPDKIVQVKIDKTKPVLTQQIKIALTSGTLLNGGNIPVTLDNWLGADPNGPSPSGLDHYLLSRSVNGNSFAPLTLSDPLATTDTRLVTPGTTVKFQVQSVDVAGNISNPSGTPTEGVELHQESDPAIVDTGTWTTAGAGFASGNATQFASAAGTKATFSFTGPSVAWVSAVGPDRGIAEVRIDGALKATVDLFNATQQGQRLVFAQNNIGDVAHSIEVKVLGTKNASSTGTRVDVDAFGVLNPP